MPFLVAHGALEDSLGYCIGVGTTLKGCRVVSLALFVFHGRGAMVTWHHAYANVNRIPVEQGKPAAERGHYLDPEVISQRAEKSAMYVRYSQRSATIGSTRSARHAGIA